MFPSSLLNGRVFLCVLNLSLFSLAMLAGTAMAADRVTGKNFATRSEVIAPHAMDVALPAVLGIPAEQDITMTPREAQAAYGFDVPAEAHQAMRARQHSRVFDEGMPASDAGLVESQAHIGALGALHRVS